MNSGAPEGLAVLKPDCHMALWDLKNMNDSTKKTWKTSFYEYLRGITLENISQILKAWSVFYQSKCTLK